MDTYLVKRGDTRVLLYHPVLAARADMVVYKGTLSSVRKQVKEELKAKDQEAQAKAAVAQTSLAPEQTPDLLPEVAHQDAYAAVDPDTEDEPLIDEEPEIPLDVEDVIGAIATLDREDRTHFTASGLPRIEAIEGVVGQDVSKDDRDNAWAEMRRRVNQ